MKRSTQPAPPSRDVSLIAEAEVRALGEGEAAPQPTARTLRRDESVIAEAVRLRGTAGQRFADALRRALEQALDGARRGARAIAALPKPARIGVIAAPLVILAGVATAALWPERAAPLPAVATPAAGAAPARVFVSRALDPATLPTPVAPGAAPAGGVVAPASGAAASPVAEAAPSAASPAPVASPAPSAAVVPVADPPASALDRLRQQGAPPTPLSVAEAVRTLPARASLYAAPKKGAPRTTGLAAGAEVLTYPGVPVPEGWIVARKPDGEIGFLRLSALEPKATTPATVPKLPKAKRRSLDDDEPLSRTRADERPRRRDLDEEAAPKRRSPPPAKAKRTSGKPLTADDLLLR